MPKVDLSAVVPKLGSDYPYPFNLPLGGRQARSVTAGAGVTDINANHVIVPPGCWSSQRHWHEGEDEIVVVLSGQGILIDDEGRHEMTAGDIAVFPKGDGNGHKLVNESGDDLVLLAISQPEASTVHYSDIDLIWTPEGGEQHRDGTPYSPRPSEVSGG
jgi:uncharacterized cupin superfamily protein